MTRSLRLNRRTLIKATGACLALPWLECMADEKPGDPRRFADPPRLLCFYIPGGISRPSWYPADDGRGYKLSPTLEPLARHREQFTVIRGLQPLVGQIGGHPHGRTWLTGHNIMAGSGFPNTVSMDQVFARHFGSTYCTSLVMSDAGGVADGTLSRNDQGADIPALAAPGDIFRSLMPPADASQLDAVKKRLRNKQTVVDAVHADLGTMAGQLGYADRQRLAQYAEAMHGIEQSVMAKQAAMAKGRPNVTFELPGDQAAGKTNGSSPSLVERIDLVLDLVLLGFQTDLTRVATYIASGNDDGHYGYREMPDWFKEAGLAPCNGHELWHKGSESVDPKNPYARVLARRDEILTRALARFMDKLAAIPAKDGTLLDHTQIAFGGLQSATHSGVDGPLLVAGGKKLGWKHGHHKVYYKRGDPGSAKVPLSNLWLTIMQQAGCPVTSFKESTGTLSELLV